jgi:hypothetical protein
MNLGALRALASTLAFTAHGVDATVTPLGSTTPVPTRVIWLPQVGPSAQAFTDRPYGSDFQRREPRRVLASQRSDALTDVPRGSVLRAPERGDLEAKTWIVDGHDLTDVAQIRVMVIPEVSA